MTDFSEALLMGPAYLGLSDKAARLLFRAALYLRAHKLAAVTPVVLRVLQAKRAEGDELCAAGLWLAYEDSYLPATESARVRAARVAGQASARARAERGNAQPTLTQSFERLFEPTLQPTLEPKSQRTFEAKDPSNSLPPGSPSPSQNSGSFSALSEISFPLLAISQGPESKRARVREKKPGRETWRRVPTEWQPSAEHARIAADRRVDFALEIAKFRDHEFATPKRDPDATFRNWLRSAKPALGARPPVSTGYKHATLDEIDQILGAK